ncbi:iron permease FTR1 [Rhizophagus irregularis]|uniref:Iron permease FTR1 n=2 Tax=Rhizophagus irregularis TaxID=588596 RepID=A0A2I1FXX6_9GLOM|nr:putative iron permease [Rhizophagus irregularis DAOM 181602=DAOM 197198]PKC12239.1 iron permease FTR1 [Rhizophagus irregularis]PKC62468.1 iron permease FTR1 [Rhizophagus irregularis]PKK69952.1 iron permease FTR1 [Rhizophagus irregularis]PKY25403.1 iron permease FTR1 [Rhizophagus irregularis]PKY39231.1 iron permease FTR1 [Rhizophagus irregularis]|eukprot:XP_025165805.1 putative iron permease [Rhizophagus irregularis DAOM 181602=DAOM 197198]
MVYLFDVPAYFILLRETLEATIILAVLLGFIDKLVLDDESVRKKLKRQIWYGTAAGLGVSLLIGAIFIGIFYTIKRNLWEESEAAWEGSFCLIASIVITFMALSMLRVNQWRAKWENKLKEATENYLQKHERGNKWALIILPFTVVCREGVETFVFMAGIGFQNPATGLPIPIILGIFTGFLIGFVIYKGSHRMSMAVFFNITTVFLLFVAAGLFSTSIHELQEATETYEQVLWQLDCCDNKNRFWSLMSTIFGWRNKATVGTTVGYFIYWIFVVLVAMFMLYREKRKHNDQSNNVEKNERDERNEKDDQAAIVNAA